MTHLDLSDQEADALARLLRAAIDGDRYPLSPRIRTLKAILAKLELTGAAAGTVAAAEIRDGAARRV